MSSSSSSSDFSHVSEDAPVDVLPDSGRVRYEEDSFEDSIGRESEDDEQYGSPEQQHDPHLHM